MNRAESVDRWKAAPPPGPSVLPFKKAAAFTFVQASDLELKPPEFLLDGLLETETLGLLFGDPGCGKSFLAVDLALCVATGTAFHGRDVSKPGPVFYIAGEGHSGLARRFHAWARHHGQTLDDVPLFKSERAAQFLDAASARAVAGAAQTLAGQHGPPALIVIDTLARNFGGGDENSTQDMNDFVSAMDDLRAHWLGCCVLIVHHSGHNEKGRARGAMALKGALDFEFQLVKAGRDLTLHNTKMKDAEPPDDMFFALEGVDIAPGINSAVLARQGEPPKAEKALSAGQALGLKTFRLAAIEHGQFDEEGRFTGLHLDDWRPAFYAEHTGDNLDAKKKAFQRARGDLKKSGRLIVQDDVYSTTDVATLMTISAKRDNGTGQDI